MLGEYLKHIGLDALPVLDIAGLERLQRAHGSSFGFENLDVRLGRPIRIDSASVFEKFVRRGRGGYCFEQNRLFADALAAMGLSSRFLLARALLNLPEDEVPPFTHACLLVELEGEQWLIDAGFGGMYIAPMPIRDGAVGRSGHRLRRIGDAVLGEWLLEFSPVPPGAGEQQWQRQYSFDLREVAQSDLEQASHWTSTREGSRFLTIHIATIALANGFASMQDRQLSLYQDGQRELREIADAGEYGRVLREIFRIQLSDGDVQSLPLFAGD